MGLSILSSRAQTVLLMLLVFLGVFFMAVGGYYFFKKPPTSLESSIPSENLILWARYEKSDLPWFITDQTEIFFQGDKRAIALYELEDEIIPIFFSLDASKKSDFSIIPCQEWKKHTICSPSPFAKDILEPLDPFINLESSQPHIIFSDTNIFWVKTTPLLSLLKEMLPRSLQEAFPSFLSTHSHFIFGLFEHQFPDFSGSFSYQNTQNIFHLSLSLPKEENARSPQTPKAMRFSPSDLPADADFLFSTLSGDEWIRLFFELAKEYEYSYGLTLKDSIQKKLSQSFLSSLSLDQDIFPLFSGRTVISTSPTDTTLFFSTPSTLLAEKKYEKVEKIWLQYWKSQIPEIISHTLADGTVIQEVFPRSDIFNNIQNTYDDYNITQFTSQIRDDELQPFSLVQKKQELYLFSTDKTEQIPLFNKEKTISPLFYNLPIEINHPYEIASLAFFPSRFPFFTSLMAYRISSNIISHSDHYSLDLYIEG